MSDAPQFQKRPVKVQAIRNDGSDACAVLIEEWSGGLAHRAKPWKTDYGVIEVETLHGPTDAWYGCWVIKGPTGDFWPCEPEVFAESYEPVVSWRIPSDPGEI